ncbi:MAG: hypothetical protein R2798_14645 [Chitinophagales bacterium]
MKKIIKNLWLLSSAVLLLVGNALESRGQTETAVIVNTFYGQKEIYTTCIEKEIFFSEYVRTLNNIGPFWGFFLEFTSLNTISNWNEYMIYFIVENCDDQQLIAASYTLEEIPFIEGQSANVYYFDLQHLWENGYISEGDPCPNSSFKTKSFMITKIENESEVLMDYVATGHTPSPNPMGWYSLNMLGSGSNLSSFPDRYYAIDSYLNWQFMGGTSSIGELNNSLDLNNLFPCLLQYIEQNGKRVTTKVNNNSNNFCDNNDNDWNITENDFCDYATVFGSNNFTNDYHDQAGLTIHWVVKAYYEYLRIFHKYESEIGVTIYHIAMGSGFDSEGNLYNKYIHGGAYDVELIGHEMSHGGVGGGGFYDFMDEGLPDVIGMGLEFYTQAGNPNWIYDWGRGDITRHFDFDSDGYYAGVGGIYEYHIKGRTLSHFYYLLAIGPDFVTKFSDAGVDQSILEPDGQTIDIAVCGIGERASSRVIFEGFRMGTAPTALGYRNNCVNAVDALVADPTEVGLYGLDANFVKAQVRNAWAAVNVGDPDFRIAQTTNDVLDYQEEFVYLNLCMGKPLNLVAGTKAGVSIQWWKDGVPISTTESSESEGYKLETLNIPSVQESDAGTYTAEVTYDRTGNGDYCSVTKNIHVGIYYLTLSSDADNNIACENDMVTLTAEAHPSIDTNSAKWYVDEIYAPQFDGQTSIQVSYSNFGQHTYTIEAICTLETDPVFSETLTLDVQPIPQNANIVALVGEGEAQEPVDDSITICEGDEISLSAFAEYMDNVVWSTNIPNDPNIYPENNAIQISPQETTTYTASISNSCGTVTETFTVTVIHPPTLSLTATETDFCGSGIVTLSASATNANISWASFPDVGINGSTSNSITVNVTENTIFNVVTTDNECGTLNQTISVLVHPTPTASAGTDQSICQGESTQLTATGGISYAWSPATGLDNPNIANPTASPTSTTTYTVSVTDENGCTDSDEVTISILPNPSVTIAEQLSYENCTYGSAAITATENANYTYQWLLNGNLLTENATTHQYLAHEAESIP